MQKVLGKDRMNFATNSTGVDELNAMTQESQRQTHHTFPASNPAHMLPYNPDPRLAGLHATDDKQGPTRSRSWSDVVRRGGLGEVCKDKL